MKFILFVLTVISLSACGSSESAPVACGTDACGFCEADRTGLRICGFVATPTPSESVTLMNYTTSAITLTGYTIWDANAYSHGTGQKTLQSSDVIGAGSQLSFTSLPFAINDSGERIYLKNASGTTLDERTN